jgi:hypothetical protein
MQGEIVDLFIKAKREVLRENSKILSSFAGLFWFSDDYKDIIETKGMVEFTDTDAATKQTVLPEGSHASYKGKRFEHPRGRVELNAGVPAISIGDACPDDVIEYIVKFMGLNKYRNIIEVRRSSFWDQKE